MAEGAAAAKTGPVNGIIHYHQSENQNTPAGNAVCSRPVFAQDTWKWNSWFLRRTSTSSPLPDRPPLQRLLEAAELLPKQPHTFSPVPSKQVSHGSVTAKVLGPKVALAGGV